MSIEVQEATTAIGVGEGKKRDIGNEVAMTVAAMKTSLQTTTLWSLSFLRLFHVGGNVVQNERRVLLIDCRF